MAKIPGGKRVTIFLSEEILAKIESFAMENGLNRSSAISVMANQFMQSQDLVKTLGEVVKLANDANNKSN